VSVSIVSPIIRLICAIDKLDSGRDWLCFDRESDARAFPRENRQIHFRLPMASFVAFRRREIDHALGSIAVDLCSRSPAYLGASLPKLGLFVLLLHDSTLTEDCHSGTIGFVLADCGWRTTAVTANLAGLGSFARFWVAS